MFEQISRAIISAVLFIFSSHYLVLLMTNRSEVTETANEKIEK